MPDAGTAGMSDRSPTRAAPMHASLAPLVPRASPPLPVTGSVPVLSTLFTTSVWRKSMPGRNAIGHAVAHTWPRSGWPGGGRPGVADHAGPETGALRGAQTQAYTPGATGPQAPYDSGDLFSPRDPYTRQGPGPGGPPGGPGEPGRRAGAPGKANGF